MDLTATAKQMGQQGEEKPVVQVQGVEVLVVQGEVKGDLGKGQMGKIMDMQRC